MHRRREENRYEQLLNLFFGIFLARLLTQEDYGMVGVLSIFSLIVFPSDKAEAVMSVLEENARALRGELGSKVGKQLRIVPEIAFYLDSSLDYVEHIEELLKK